MFFRARRTLQRAWFDFNCRSLLDTPPIHASDPSLTLVSMVCHGEVLMYLLAAKSFCRQLGRTPQVVILNDGSLTNPDHANIRAHLPEARIVHISEVAPANTPKGSCWERLLLISDLVKDTFVLQLDSDTLCRCNPRSPAVYRSKPQLYSSGRPVLSRGRVDDECVPALEDQPASHGAGRV